MPGERFVSPRFYYTFGPHPASITIDPGKRLLVVCPDSDNEMANGTLLTEQQRQCRAGSEPLQGNPMAGPIHVNGAVPGDCLAITINAIELDRATGQTLLAPAHGVLPDHLLRGENHELRIPRHMYRWSIDTRRGRATLTNPLGSEPLEVALDPFIGCIGVCPKWSQSISTLFAGSFGGNMDVPCVRPGATLYLPVYAEGAGLLMGDIHGAQGHGEIIGGAIETSGVIDCTMHLMREKPIVWPRLRDSENLFVIVSEGDLRMGVQYAYAQLIEWLASDFGINRWDAYNLVSQTGRILLGGIGMAPYTVAAGIAMSALPPGAVARAKEKLL